MVKNDLEQISKLLDKKFEENNKKIDIKFEENNKEILKEIDIKFEKNNKEIDKKIDDKIDKFEENIMTATKRGFDEVDSRFERVEEELTDVKQDIKKIKDVQENIYQRICDQTDNEIKDLQLDMDKVKYIHKKEWNKLPQTYEISKVLVKSGLKKK